MLCRYHTGYFPLNFLFCNSKGYSIKGMYPVLRKCMLLKVGSFKSLLNANGIGYSRFSAAKLSKLMVNVEKLQSSSIESNTEVEEQYADKIVMGNRLEDICPTEEDSHFKAVHYFAGNNTTNRSGGGLACREICQKGYSKSSKPGNSIYNNRTMYLTEDIKQKLSWIRINEYSNYGEELLKANKIKSIQNELFTIATYNVLSQDLLEKHNYIYSKHDDRCLNWTVRKEILFEEFALLDADILCLQEVDFYISNSVYRNCLKDRGYEGVYEKKTRGKTDGCAIYYKTDKFNLVSSLKVELFNKSVKLLDKDNIGVIVKLSLKDRPEVEIIVATTHLLYNPKRADIKLVQTQIMLAEIERIAYKRTNPVTGEPEYLPIIFTGDMNYSPESAVYQLVTKSYFEYEGKPNKYLLPCTDGFTLNKTLLPASVGITDSCQFLSSLANRGRVKNVKFETGVLEHPLNLSSVYNHIKNEYPEATTNQEGWLTVDYIFYSQLVDNVLKSRSDGNLKLVSKLTLPNSIEAERELVNIPNLGCGSDHLPLLATFHVTGC